MIDFPVIFFLISRSKQKLLNVFILKQLILHVFDNTVTSSILNRLWQDVLVLTQEMHQQQSKYSEFEKLSVKICNTGLK